MLAVCRGGRLYGLILTLRGHCGDGLTEFVGLRLGLFNKDIQIDLGADVVGLVGKRRHLDDLVIAVAALVDLLFDAFETQLRQAFLRLGVVVADHAREHDLLLALADIDDDLGAGLHEGIRLDALPDDIALGHLVVIDIL